jgi:hypothetical protein
VIPDCDQAGLKTNMGDGFDIQRRPPHQTAYYELSGLGDRTCHSPPATSAGPDPATTQARVRGMSELPVQERQTGPDQLSVRSVQDPA